MRRSRGFTLLEIIITVVLVSLLASMFIPAMGTHLLRGAEPAARPADAGQALSDMEAVLREYVLYLNTSTTPQNVLTYMSTFANASVSVTWIDFDASGSQVSCSSPPDCGGLLVTTEHGGLSYSALLTNEKNATSYDAVNY
jgi:prepilin-type N-terminal cleavage/methylation domain-containing protein